MTNVKCPTSSNGEKLSIKTIICEVSKLLSILGKSPSDVQQILDLGYIVIMPMPKSCSL
jgi:hypothetical protein